MAYLGDNRFAIADEGNVVNVVTIGDGVVQVEASAAGAQRYVPAAPPTRPNVGFEGVAYRPPRAGMAAGLFVCEEGTNGMGMSVLRFDYLPSAGRELDHADGTLDVAEPWEADTALANVADDLAGMTYDTANDTLIIVSERSDKLMRVGPADGSLLEELPLVGSPQYEGVALANEGRLVVVSEPNFVELFRAD